MENPGRLGKILVGMNRALGESEFTHGAATQPRLPQLWDLAA